MFFSGIFLSFISTESSLPLGRKGGLGKRFEHGIVELLSVFSYYFCCLLLMPKPDAEFSDEMQTKAFRVFPPCYSQSPLQLCLVVSILQAHATSYVFLQTLASSSVFFQSHETSYIFLQLSNCTLYRRK